MSQKNAGRGGHKSKQQNPRAAVLQITQKPFPPPPVLAAISAILHFIVIEKHPKEQVLKNRAVPTILCG